MTPRITMNMTSRGELELWFNEEGRDLLVRELIALSETNDHFHLGSFEGADVRLSTRTYRPTDTILHAARQYSGQTNGIARIFRT